MGDHMSATTFPYHRFTGTHRQIGQQYGEACADLIHTHRDLALERLAAHAGIPTERALQATSAYRRHVVEHAAFLDDEIQGVAEGAGIALAHAYLLQLRAELYRHDFTNVDPPCDECTTFAVTPEAAADRKPLVGQNADLPAFYSQIGVVVNSSPTTHRTCSC